MYLVSQCPKLGDTRLMGYNELNKSALRWRQSRNILNVKGDLDVLDV